jgi:uncharacterized membrane protein
VTDTPTRREREEKDTARLEAFSDGVFAIAITLLVLELKLPAGSGSLGRQLVAQWPSYLAYVTSFATIGIMWLNHHRLFTLIHRVDHWLPVLNGLLLLGVSVVPFPTQLVASYLGHPGERLAVGVYGGTYIYIAFAFNALWRYASSARRKPSLIRLPHDAPEVTAIHRQYLAGPAVYTGATLLSIWHAKVALSVMLALAVYFLLPPRAKREGE